MLETAPFLFRCAKTFRSAVVSVSKDQRDKIGDVMSQVGAGIKVRSAGEVVLSPARTRRIAHSSLGHDFRSQQLICYCQAIDHDCHYKNKYHRRIILV
jgi:hypothetical protein